MNNELNFYLPNLEENSSQTYALVMKDKNVDNLESNVISNKYATLDEIMKQYNTFKSENVDDDFFIITEQTAKSINSNDNLSHNDWVKIINETYAKLGIQNDPLLTHEQLIEQKHKTKLEKAKSLGLFNEETVSFDKYLPDSVISSDYCFIIKDNNNNDLQQVTIDPEPGNINTVRKLVDMLNNETVDKKYYVVTPQFAADIPTLDNSIIANVINKTQELIGSSLRINTEIQPTETKIESPSISKENLLNPGIKEILTLDEIEAQPKTVPTPEQINNNYLPISHQFQHIKENQLEAKNRKSALSKKMVATTIGLLGVGMLSIPLAPIALPAAFLVGTAALIKSALFKGNKAEVKQWEKRKDLLTAAALDSLGATVNGKKIPKLDDMQVIENIIFTPEIEKKYNELCRKISLPPSLNEKIGNFRNGNNTSSYHKKTNGIK